MNASHKRGVRALDERATFVVHQMSIHHGPPACWNRGELVMMAALDVLRAVANPLAHDDADLARRDGVDRTVDSKTTSRRELDGEHAQIGTNRQPSAHRIVRRRVQQRGEDAHTLTVCASHEARRSAPHRCPEVPIVPGGRRGDETLALEKRAGARNDARRDADAVSACEIALARTL